MSTKGNAGGENAEAFRDDFLTSVQSMYSEGLPDSYFLPTLRLNQVLLKSLAHYERFAKRHGLNFNSLLVLMVIRYAKEPCGQRLISEALWLPKQTVGSILSNLKKKGYVGESGSPADGRAKVVSLTEDGLRFCDGVFSELHSLENAALKELEVEDIEAAARYVDAYVDAFERGLETSDASD